MCARFGGHLLELTKARDRPGDPDQGLQAVLATYAQLVSERPHGTELAALMHHKEHVTRAEHHLRSLIRGLLTEAVASGHIRGDIPPDELTSYCLHALTAAATMPSTRQCAASCRSR